MADRHLEMQEAIKCTTNIPLIRNHGPPNGRSNSPGQQPGKSPSLCYLNVRTQAGRLRFLSHSIPEYVVLRTILLAGWTTKSAKFNLQ